MNTPIPFLDLDLRCLDESSGDLDPLKIKAAFYLATHGRLSPAEQSPYALNIGALSALEKLCFTGIPGYPPNCRSSFPFARPDIQNGLPCMDMTNIPSVFPIKRSSQKHLDMPSGEGRWRISSLGTTANPCAARFRPRSSVTIGAKSYGSSSQILSKRVSRHDPIRTSRCGVTLITRYLSEVSG